MPKLCPNIRFPHQQDFFPIRSVTKSSTSRFSHENLVEKFKIFGQDFVPIRTALRSVTKSSTDENLVEKFKIFVQDFVPIRTALTIQEFFSRKYCWFYMQRIS